MKLELKRHPELVSGSVSGTLYINGVHLCDTEENPCTALPAGEYRIVRHLCKQYGRKMPVILTAVGHEQRAMSCDGVGSKEKSRESKESKESRESRESKESRESNPSLPSEAVDRCLLSVDPSQRLLSPKPRCSQCEQLEHVSNNSTMPCVCPMLKPGNGVHHRKDGSIILGTRIIPGCLKHPLHAFIPLAERIRKAIARGHKVLLVVSNDR